VSLETEYDRALQSVYVIICDLFFFACIYGAPRKGPREGTAQLGTVKLTDSHFLCVLTSVLLVSLLAKQAGLPVSRTPSLPLMYTQAGKPWSL